MNRAAWESELERCYGAFDERHEELRDQLLASLVESAPPIAGDIAHRQATHSRLWRPSMAIAACLLLGTVALLMIPWGAPKVAYGLEDLPKRLLAVHSIHLRGTSYSPSRPDRGIEASTSPLESYYERPHRYFRTTSETLPTGVRPTRIASDGQRRFTVNHQDKTVVVGKEVPLAAEYAVESWIQGSLVQQLLGGPTVAGFRKLRSEPLAGLSADVYEREFQYPQRPNRSRILVWLNPATGLPLKIQEFSKFDDKPERLCSEYDKIEINVDPPAGAFDFTPPARYAVEYHDATPDEIVAAMMAGTKSLATGEQAFHALRFCFNIDDRAALVCWIQFSDFARPHGSDLEGPLGRRLDLAPTSSLGDRAYGNHFLRVDPSPRFHWHWSLVVPEGDQRTMGEGQLVFRMTDNAGLVGTLIGTPLRFEREKLSKWIVDAQRQTLPPDAPAEAIFTLERIEELADEFRQK